MDSKIMMIGGLVVGAGVLYYAYDAYQKTKPLPYYGVQQSGAFSNNLTDQRGMPTEFPTALNAPLYPDPPASQNDVIVANLPPAVGTAIDGFCGVSSGADFVKYAESIQGALEAGAKARFLSDDSWANAQISRIKTEAGCFPTTR
jgi:hypothetical protein